jgi:hypothetical protein
MGGQSASRPINFAAGNHATGDVWGLSLLSLLTRTLPGYDENPLRHDFWRAGHAYLVLPLVMLRYVDEVVLSPFRKCWPEPALRSRPFCLRSSCPPLSPTATQTNGVISLAYIGGTVSRCRNFDPQSVSYSRRTADRMLTRTARMPTRVTRAY